MAKKLTSASSIVKKHNHDDLYYGKADLDSRFTAPDPYTIYYVIEG